MENEMTDNEQRPKQKDVSAIADMYHQRGFANRVGFGGHPALLIIDFINAFTSSASPLGSNLDAEVAATRQLLDESRRKRFGVHFTTIAYEEGCADAGVFIKKIPSLSVLRKGDPMTDIDERLLPLPGEHVWCKKYASAFFGTALASTLTAARVDTLILTGCTTSGCIRASAVDSCQNGFRTIVVREAVGDRAQPPHEANLFDIDSKYGDVVSLEEALEYLQSLRTI
jgi:nicotinamidase-related amidase